MLAQLYYPQWVFEFDVTQTNPNSFRLLTLYIYVHIEILNITINIIEELMLQNVGNLKAKDTEFRQFMRALKDRYWSRRLYALIGLAWRFRNAKHLIQSDHLADCINLLDALGRGKIEKDKEIRDGIRLSHVAIMTLREIATDEALAAAQQITNQLSDDEKTILDDLAERWNAILDDWYPE